MSWWQLIGFCLVASCWVCSLAAWINTGRILSRLKQPQMAERKPSAPWRPNQAHDLKPPTMTDGGWTTTCSCGWTTTTTAAEIMDHMEQHRLETASKRRTA